jgi:hypothetical protein
MHGHMTGILTGIMMDLKVSLVRQLGMTRYLFEALSDHFHALVCSGRMTLHVVSTKQWRAEDRTGQISSHHVPPTPAVYFEYYAKRRQP